MTIVENLQRTDLDPMERLVPTSRLSYDFKPTQEQMASRTHRRRIAPSVGEISATRCVCRKVCTAVETVTAELGHARALLAPDVPETITSAAQKVMALSLSVGQTENDVQGLINPEGKEKEAGNSQTARQKIRTSARQKTRLRRSLEPEGEDRGQEGQGQSDYRVRAA